MSDLVLLGKALADPTRIRILALLRGGELCVCEIADVLEITQSTLSTHLQSIRQTGLVTTRKNVKWSYYRLAPEAASLLDFLFQQFQESLDSDPLYRRDRARMEQRLQMRVDGCCVISMPRLESTMKGGEPR